MPGLCVPSTFEPLSDQLRHEDAWWRTSPGIYVETSFGNMRLWRNVLAPYRTGRNSDRRATRHFCIDVGNCEPSRHCWLQKPAHDLQILSLCDDADCSIGDRESEPRVLPNPSE